MLHDRKFGEFTTDKNIVPTRGVPIWEFWALPIPRVNNALANTDYIFVKINQH